MRVGFVSIPRFLCAAETHRDPALARRPLIVGDAEEPKRVLDCSEAAEARHVRPGMTIRKALAECPDAAVLPPDQTYYWRVWRDTLAALDELTPEIEHEELGRCYLNLSGLDGHYRDETGLCEHVLGVIEAVTGLKASLGLSTGKFPALAAAYTAGAGGIRVVPARREAEFVSPLPVDLLPFDAKVLSRLRLLGLETLGDVAVLTIPELQSQFGFEGERIWQLANGIDSELLRPRPRVEQLVDSLSFEAPVAGIDVLVAGSKQLFSRLRPLLRGRAMRELTLEAELTSGRGWERRLVLREAVSETDRLLFVLRSALQNAPPPMAVHSLSLRLAGLTGETGKQMSLGERGRLQRQLEESIQQLKARYGYSPVFRCVDVEPWSAVPEERQILVESDG